MKMGSRKSQSSQRRLRSETAHDDDNYCRVQQAWEGVHSAKGKIDALISFLASPSGKEVLVSAHRESLQHKLQRYTQLFEEAEREVEREREIISLKMPDLKQTSNVQGEQDNWLIFESVSRKYIESRDRATVFDAIRSRARSKLNSPFDADVLSADLVQSLKRLRTFVDSQCHVVETVVDLVGSFLKNPQLVRTKFVNFMFVGGSGTGKTTLAGIIASCLAKSGMFVEDKVIDAGRAEFVAEYEGQTVARTRNFLISNLDRGIIFVDEAYALTKWNDGNPEGYGAEAVTAMMEFMSRYKGLYCIIVAGYEKEMSRYFLPTNSGLARRFPYRFALRDLEASQLVRVFKCTLLTEQGLDLTDSDVLDSEHYFSDDAWKYLRQLIGLCTSGRHAWKTEEYDRSTRCTYSHIREFVPNYPFLYQLFEHQAGSMTNLAEECITVLMSKTPLSHISHKRTRNWVPFQLHQPTSVMQQVIRKRICNSALTSVPEFFLELEHVERILFGR